MEIYTEAVGALVLQHWHCGSKVRHKWSQAVFRRTRVRLLLPPIVMVDSGVGTNTVVWLTSV